MKQPYSASAVRILCPLFNAEKYVDHLHQTLLNQQGTLKPHIHYIITQGTDATIEKVRALKHCTFNIITPKEFSHSLTREAAIQDATEDIIVLISQDIIIEPTDWLQHLITPIIEQQCEATFSRQICRDQTSIEKYVRDFNYPAQSYFSSQADLATKGIKAFFFSDAASALRRSTFLELGGYDHRHFPINEDMYYAYKLITHGYKIKYCADSVVFHHHSFTLRQQFRRYRDTGLFLRQNPDLAAHKTNQAGASLASYILKQALKEKNFPVLLHFLPSMTARFLGLKLGKLQKPHTHTTKPHSTPSQPLASKSDRQPSISSNTQKSSQRTRHAK